MRSLALVSLLVSTALAAPLNSRSDTARRGQSLSIPCTQKLPSAKRLLSKRQATGTPVSQQSTIGNENDVRYIAAVTIAGESLNVSEANKRLLEASIIESACLAHYRYWVHRYIRVLRGARALRRIRPIRTATFIQQWYCPRRHQYRRSVQCFLRGWR